MASRSYTDGGDDYNCEIEFNGASNGNPGKAGAGAVIHDRCNNTTWHVSKGLGQTANHAAEYEGLILGMKTALEKGYQRVYISRDSSLVCNQISSCSVYVEGGKICT